LPGCRNDIVVLTDARQAVHPRAVARLLANFSNPRIGAVSGELEFVRGGGESAAARGVDTYWRYEKWIRRNEAKWGSVPGATGALYAIRRGLFRPIPADTLLDDVAIPLSIVRQGRRCVFEEEARVYDAPSGTPREESVRKRRTIAGVCQLVARDPALLWPGRNPIWFQFVSHKVARLFSPLLLVGLVVMNVLLRAQPLYKEVLIAQGIFYLAAGAGWCLSRCGVRSRLLGAALMFVNLNLTTLQALADALRGRYRVTWDRSPQEKRSA
jgi:cellulose synthase/poly-beta-1,6-N-acetylglucosamine synthase-like glycosyltransferase